MAGGGTQLSVAEARMFEAPLPLRTYTQRSPCSSTSSHQSTLRDWVVMPLLHSEPSAPRLALLNALPSGVLTEFALSQRDPSLMDEWLESGEWRLGASLHGAHAFKVREHHQESSFADLLHAVRSQASFLSSSKQSCLFGQRGGGWSLYLASGMPYRCLAKCYCLFYAPCSMRLDCSD